MHNAAKRVECINIWLCIREVNRPLYDGDSLQGLNWSSCVQNLHIILPVWFFVLFLKFLFLTWKNIENKISRQWNISIWTRIVLQSDFNTSSYYGCPLFRFSCCTLIMKWMSEWITGLTGSTIWQQFFIDYGVEKH